MTTDGQPQPVVKALRRLLAQAWANEHRYRDYCAWRGTGAQRRCWTPRERRALLSEFVVVPALAMTRQKFQRSALDHGEAVEQHAPRKAVTIHFPVEHRVEASAILDAIRKVAKQRGVSINSLNSAFFVHVGRELCEVLGELPAYGPIPEPEPVQPPLVELLPSRPYWGRSAKRKRRQRRERQWG